MKTLKKLILIIPIISIFLINSKCYGVTSEQTIVKNYEVKQSEENEFLENIYNSETDEKKIESVNKNISVDNYTSKEITEIKTLTSKETDYIYQEFGQTREYIDDEYKGTLTITDIQIETINNGYYEKIDEQVLEFSNYTDNDLNNIEKEITINNRTYYLINVNWEADATEIIDGETIPLTYKGNKVYQTIQKINYADTYNITVTYSGQVEKIDTNYDYSIIYKNVVETAEENVIEEENEDTNIVPIIIVSGIGITIILVYLFNRKNTYIYSKVDKGFKVIKKEKINDNNVLIDITNCKNKSKENIYALKINTIAFNNLKGRTISIVNGSKRKDIVLWNNYYEIKL